jgi:tRNA(fMet)-specific endonuclease VapC
MNGKYLLDSNIIIDYLRGDSEVISKVDEIENLYIPVIVIGELYYGAYKLSPHRNGFEEIQKLEKRATIFNVENSTAQRYGQIKNQLRMIGKPIPENDIWIAAIAIENDLTLITKDKHFDFVTDIKLEKI